ncbi:hypothetical protein TWF102_008395 [Orbilia oligospora]|uniref:Uncharacterized protein n=1 Tax=Orbilia oligospora TaxID=2813651 RepID=A0A7C8JBY1_ORBOL|nr:hypothetical protein TWF102_008395 [Orbilia oligospora]KAF3096307.1 hypothetical protein TWF103_009880 [Orbilia oligospora]
MLHEFRLPSPLENPPGVVRTLIKALAHTYDTYHGTLVFGLRQNYPFSRTITVLESKMDREIQNPASFTFPYIPPAATGSMLSPFAMMMPTGVRLHNSNPTPQNPQVFIHSHNTLTDKEWLNKVEVEFQKLDGLFGGLLRDVNESTVVISRLEQQVERDGKVIEALMIEKRRLEAKNHQLQKELQLQMATQAHLPNFSLKQ